MRFLLRRLEILYEYGTSKVGLRRCGNRDLLYAMPLGASWSPSSKPIDRHVFTAKQKRDTSVTTATSYQHYCCSFTT